MTIAITPGETWEYITKADRELPKEEQTVWVLRALDGSESRRLNNSLVSSDRDMKKLSFTLADYQEEALKCGLIGAVNFKDSAGNIIEFETVKVGTLRGSTRQASAAFLALVPAGVQVELAEQIINNTQLEPADVKN